MTRTFAIYLLAALAALALMLLTARAYDYEQSSLKDKPRIGKALYCEGRPPAPVLCSYYGSRQKQTVRYYYWISGIL